ncbi:MAG: BREX-1 system phosphatase PglZ type A [Victivallales bacterium]|nr:BREX-1 system phosphatase PglZ type A [Victivallales bacterium]
MTEIEKQLENLFKDYRLIFWYDETGDMEEDFQNASLQDVQKVHVVNNEFSIKYKVVKEFPETKFLLYFKHKQPKNEDNWLLDLLLSGKKFYTDKSALLLQSLGLDISLRNFIAEHYDFFAKSVKRKEKLQKLISKSDSIKEISYKMLSVICSCDTDLNSIIFSLSDELVKDSDKKYRDIERLNLADFLWRELKNTYNYCSDNPSIKDFIISLFNTCFNTGENIAALSREAFVLLNRWKDSTKNSAVLRALSEQIQDELCIGNILNHMDINSIKDDDLYKLIDKKIIFEIANSISNDKYTHDELMEVIETRKNKFWYSEFADIYNAIICAIEFINSLNVTNLKPGSIEDYYLNYTSYFYKLDTAYRKFILYHSRAGQNNLLSPIYKKVEQLYSNRYLLTLNDNWQNLFEAKQEWQINGVVSQKKFYKKHVKPYLDKNLKLFVIISDALRYECGIELKEIINSEDRLVADIDNMYSMLPSYTQMGMAALLPNKTISYKDDASMVYADDMSTLGTENRIKVLQANHSRSCAITADDFLSMNSKTEGRDFAKKYDLIYIYNNGIDAIGDSKKTESNVFQAVEDEFEKIIKLLRHIYNVGGSNSLITADHGFIYQNMELDESDFIGAEQIIEKKNCLKYDRRFILGNNLPTLSSFKKFKAANILKPIGLSKTKALSQDQGKSKNEIERNTLGYISIDSSIDVLIPKSINRLRLKGSGAKYVHGGMSLQEIVIPVIKTSYRKKDKVNQVDIDILGKPERITSGQLSLKFYQLEPIAEKRLSRDLRIGFYSPDSKLISNREDVSFESVDPVGDNRTKRLTFIFSKDIDRYNNKEIELRLEEQIKNSNQYRTYKKYKFIVQKTFEQDFDF